MSYDLFGYKAKKAEKEKAKKEELEEHIKQLIEQKFVSDDRATETKLNEIEQELMKYTDELVRETKERERDRTTTVLQRNTLGRSEGDFNRLVDKNIEEGVLTEAVAIFFKGLTAKQKERLTRQGTRVLWQKILDSNNYGQGEPVYRPMQNADIIKDMESVWNRIKHSNLQYAWKELSGEKKEELVGAIVLTDTTNGNKMYITEKGDGYLLADSGELQWADFEVEKNNYKINSSWLDFFNFGGGKTRRNKLNKRNRANKMTRRRR